MMKMKIIAISMLLLLTRINASFATHCFMVNDINQRLQWRLAGSNDPCACSQILTGGVITTLNSVVDCIETNQLLVSGNSDRIAYNYGCDVMESQSTIGAVSDDTPSAKMSSSTDTVTTVDDQPHPTTPTKSIHKGVFTGSLYSSSTPCHTQENESVQTTTHLDQSTSKVSENVPATSMTTVPTTSMTHPMTPTSVSPYTQSSPGTELPTAYSHSSSTEQKVLTKQSTHDAVTVRVTAPLMSYQKSPSASTTVPSTSGYHTTDSMIQSTKETTHLGQTTRLSLVTTLQSTQPPVTTHPVSSGTSSTSGTHVIPNTTIQSTQTKTNDPNQIETAPLLSSIAEHLGTMTSTQKGPGVPNHDTDKITLLHATVGGIGTSTDQSANHYTSQKSVHISTDDSTMQATTVLGVTTSTTQPFLPTIAATTKTTTIPFSMTEMVQEDMLSTFRGTSFDHSTTTDESTISSVTTLRVTPSSTTEPYHSTVSTTDDYASTSYNGITAASSSTTNAFQEGTLPTNEDSSGEMPNESTISISTYESTVPSTTTHDITSVNFATTAQPTAVTTPPFSTEASQASLSSEDTTESSTTSTTQSLMSTATVRATTNHVEHPITSQGTIGQLMSVASDGHGTIDPSTEVLNNSASTPVTCECEHQYEESCYILVNYSLSLSDAESYCKEREMWLVTLQGLNETDFVINMVNAALTTDTDYWIGLKKTDIVWAKANTYLSYDNMWTTTITPDQCFYYDKTTQNLPWRLKLCFDMSDVICEVKYNIAIANNFTCIIVYAGTCYVQLPANTEALARLRCKYENNGHLLQLETAEEEALLEPFISYNGVWLGLKRKMEMHPYVWKEDMDKIPMVYSYFGALFGEYRGTCVLMDASESYQWVDVNCSSLNFAVCERSLETNGC